MSDKRLTETGATSQDMWLNQLGEKFPGGLIGVVGIISIVVVLLAVTVARRKRKMLRLAHQLSPDDPQCLKKHR